MAKEKVCHIVAGPNGAGKTTFALSFLRYQHGCERFINSDLIAQGLSPLCPEAVRVQASKLFLRSLEQAVNEHKPFAFETTLAGKGYVKLLKQLKNDGWALKLYYLFLPDVEMALARVQARVSADGHSIPEEEVRRRYFRSLNNLFKLYIPLADETFCFDNRDSVAKIVFTAISGKINILDDEIYRKMQELACE